MCHNSCCLLDAEFSAVLLWFDTVCCLTVKQVINLPPTCHTRRQLSLHLFQKANCPTMKRWPSDWVSIDKQLCGMNTQPRGSWHWAIVSKRLLWICIISFIIIGGSCRKHDFCCDKSFSWPTRVCRNSHVFVTTKIPVSYTHLTLPTMAVV